MDEAKKSDTRVSLPRRPTVAARFHNGLAEIVAGYGEALHDLETRLQVAEAQARVASDECERLRGALNATREQEVRKTQLAHALRGQLDEVHKELAEARASRA